MLDSRSKKILYMGEPRIKFNQIETNVLSIVDKEKDYELWLYNNFIHLIIGSNGHWGAFLFSDMVLKDCPWIEVTRIERRLVQANIKEFIKSMIDNGCYLWFNVECSQISVYEKQMIFHDIFIYGYDDENNIFYAADFFQEGHYERRAIPYNQIIKGYEDMSQYKDPLGIYIIWKKEEEYKNQYTNTNIIIKDSMEKYLYGNYPFGRQKYYENKSLQSHKYGIDIYEVLVNYCNNIIKKKDQNLDYRIFDMLYQHKKIMYERIVFLNKREEEEKYNYETAKNIVNVSLIIRNMFLKYMLVENFNILEKVILKLNVLKEMETTYYQEIIENM